MGNVSEYTSGRNYVFAPRKLPRATQLIIVLPLVDVSPCSFGHFSQM